MKDHIIVAYCDGPVHGEEWVNADVERTLSVDGSNPVLVDLCAECDGSLISPVFRLIHEGQPVEQPKKRKSPAKRVKPETKATVSHIKDYAAVSMRTCPDCGHVSASRDALGMHTRKQHNKGLKEYDWAV
jgi:hypothetical protein